MTSHYRGTDPNEEVFAWEREPGEIQAQPRNSRPTPMSKVYEAFDQFLQTGDGEQFHKVAGKHRTSLSFRITFEAELKKKLSKAKNADDFTLCRKIAFFDGLFNPTSLFPKMIQALDYLRMGNSLSAFSLLDRRNKDSNLEMGYAISEQAHRYAIKNPLVSHHLTNLLELFSKTTSSRKRKREDNELGLRV